MAIPATRDQFTEYCLRKLGKPVIEINVDADQLDDRVDEALKYYWDYHFDGTEMIYYKHIVTANTVSSASVTVPDNIIGVVEMFPIGNFGTGAGDIFNIQYQIALNDLYTLTNVSMVPYYMTMEHVAFLQELLVGAQPIRYNRHKNIINIDMDFNKVHVGDYLLFRAYQVVDPTTYTEVWGDRWLQNYCTQLIKKQWGSNLTKFSGLQLPGGVTFNGQQLYDEAVEELKLMEDEMINSYSLPVMDLTG